MNFSWNIMKQHLIFTCLLSITFLNSCTINSKKTDLSKTELNGKVKSVSTVSYDAVLAFGEVGKGKKQVDWDFEPFIEFNEQGNIVKIEIYDWESYEADVTLRRDYIYNEQGHIVEILNYDSKGKLEFKTKLTSDSEGNVIEGHRYTEKEIDEHFVNNYDERSNWIEMLSKTASEDIEIRDLREYDENDNLVSFKSFSDGQLKRKESYKYNKKNKIIEHSIYSTDGAVYERFVYKYDKQGKLIEEEQFLKEELNTVRFYSPENGLELRMESRGKDDNDRKWTYKYKFDQNGNWIERTQYFTKNNNSSEEPQNIIERQITYYP